ncbi:DUF55-domain-containing protein [Xylariaceae sp. FL1019]|nr:DUF55-domain-containing protein [Xylariaceae sp. FL1019]
MPKRKAQQLDPETDIPSLRRSTRRKPEAVATQSSRATSPNTDSTPASKPKSRPRANKSDKLTPTPVDAEPDAASKPKSTTKGKANKPTTTASTNEGTWYWLMKAEPETRIERGVDVRFSIDDLASRTEPEPWDGIRNYVARNNLRSMKKGELAFFYHSNCKEPGIVGTMEIVQEHSPDLSAHDPNTAYYDPKSKPEDPKWSVVHVKFRSKFANSIGLQELKELGKTGQPLEDMQMLRQSRLSVSRVSPAEWEFLMNVAAKRGGEVSADS